MSLPRIAIAIGDPAGIGPELALKTALDARVRAIAAPVLVGDPLVIAAHAAGAGLDSRLAEVALLPRAQFAPGEFVLGSVSAQNGRASLDYAAAAIAAARAGEVKGVVAAPMNQTAIAAAGIAFDGYPGFLARQCGVPEADVFLMLCFDTTRIVHVTLHVPVRAALDLLTQARITHAILAADAALKRLGIAQPRIGVGGLNPHAGEGGLFGREDDAVTAPAIAAARAAGATVDGPFGTDTMFHKPGYDAFTVMLHDQGHIAAKMVAAHRTAGLAIGTEVLFSSVAHGSGHDIAGRGQADPTAMIAAVHRLCGQTPA